MPLESVPWFVGKGAEHSPELTRAQLYAALDGGSEGVFDAADFKVRANSPAGTDVLVSQGIVAMRNRYPGGASQMYAARNANADEVVPTSATPSGSARSDLVVVRIDDPQYGGSQPADPRIGPYTKMEVIPGVSSTTKKFSELGRNYPGYAIARIDRPANTATVLDANIVDLRKMALPKRERFMRTYALTGADTDAVAGISNVALVGEIWPNIPGDLQVDIPEWANRARISLEWRQVKIPGGNVTGAVWARLGVWNGDATTKSDTQEVSINTTGVAAGSRTNYGVSDDIYVPAALRGTTRSVLPYSRRTSGTAGTAPVVDSWSAVSLDIEFYEAAAEAL